MSRMASRLPPSASQRAQRSVPPTRPSSSNHTRLRIGRMTAASWVSLPAAPRGSSGMKVRARPSATSSRGHGAELSPRAWMPIQ